jgi:hypothetical protein
MKLTDADVDRLAKQTPCLCGDIESWHSECYRGKTDEQIQRGYKRAYNIARRTLQVRIEADAAAAIRSAALRNNVQGDGRGDQ